MKYAEQIGKFRRIEGEAPAYGETVEVADGVLWLRLPLPYQLDHVNIYLLREGNGWAVIDAGIYDARTVEIWEALFEGVLKGTPLTRLLVSHHHPDHMGAAGWLAKRCDIPLLATRQEYLIGKYLGTGSTATNGDFQLQHFLKNGATDAAAALVVEQGLAYLRSVSSLPDVYQPLEAGERLELGGRCFEVFTGGGHSPDQAMLWCAEDDLFFSADQVISKISPNVSVMAAEPEADPLGRFIASLTELQEVIGEEAFTLPGHRTPLKAPCARMRELISHHALRCDELEALLSGGAQSAHELTPQLFPRLKDPHQLSFAFAEVLAHLNYMRGQGRLVSAVEGGVQRFGCA